MVDTTGRVAVVDCKLLKDITDPNLAQAVKMERILAIVEKTPGVNTFWIDTSDGEVHLANEFRTYLIEHESQLPPGIQVNIFHQKESPSMQRIIESAQGKFLKVNQFLTEYLGTTPQGRKTIRQIEEIGNAPGLTEASSFNTYQEKKPVDTEVFSELTKSFDEIHKQSQSKRVAKVETKVFMSGNEGVPQKDDSSWLDKWSDSAD